MQNEGLCLNCHGQLFVIIDFGWHGRSKFSIVSHAEQKQLICRAASPKWALSFAGTWTLCLHASSYNLKNRCQHCLRTSRYLGYWKA